MNNLDKMMGDPMTTIDNLVYDIHAINKKFKFRQQNSIYIPVKHESIVEHVKVLVAECDHINTEVIVEDDEAYADCTNCGKDVTSTYDWSKYFGDKHDNFVMSLGGN